VGLSKIKLLLIVNHVFLDVPERAPAIAGDEYQAFPVTLKITGILN